jgi:cold shock protein
MPSHGIVREFHPDEGWGVIDGPDVPGGAWTGFAAVQVAGYRALMAGQPVTFEAEPGEQDGFAFRATTVWPDDAAGDRPAEPSGPSAAYTSTLRLTFDQPPDRPPADG